MTDILENIAQYEESYQLLRQRINELCGLIHSSEKSGDIEAGKRLRERRYRLYCLQWEVQSGMRALQDYWENVAGDKTPVRCVVAENAS